MTVIAHFDAFRVIILTLKMLVTAATDLKV